MPEPGAGSGGARGGSGMGAGDRGGYGGGERDVFGREPDRIGYEVDPRSEGKVGGYWSGERSRWIGGKAPVTRPSLIQTYLEDYAVPKVAPVSRPAPKPVEHEAQKHAPRIAPVSTYDGPSTSVQPGIAFENKPTPPSRQKEQFQTKPVSDMTQILSKLTSKQELTPDIIRALTMDQVRPGSKYNLANVTINDQLVKDLGKKLGINVGAYYDPTKDKTVVTSDFTTGDVVHELGHRDLQSALRAGRTWDRQAFEGQLRERSLPTSVLDQIQMPDVQALYETGENPFSAGYGAQGEMVSSRAGTARNLYDAMSKFSGGGEDWVDTVLNAPSEYRKSRPLSHAAIKAGWSGNTALDPNAQVMAMTVRGVPPFQDPAWEDDPNFQEPYVNLPGVNVAHPTHSVPGSGNWAAGYQALLDKRQELPNKFVGGEYTPKDWMTLYGDPMQAAGTSLPTYTGITRTPTGLRNHPLKQQHGLIQEFVLRNQALLGNKSKDVAQALANKDAAQGAPASSMINKLERLNLPSQFWDRLDDFYSTGWNPYYSPEQGQTMIDNYLSGAPKWEGQPTIDPTKYKWWKK